MHKDSIWYVDTLTEPLTVQLLYQTYPQPFRTKQYSTVRIPGIQQKHCKQNPASGNAVANKKQNLLKEKSRFEVDSDYPALRNVELCTVSDVYTTRNDCNRLSPGGEPQSQTRLT